MAKERKALHKSPKTYSGRKFSGVLLEPIEISLFPDLVGDDKIDSELQKIQQEILEDANRQLLMRFEALLDHYGVTGKSTAEIFYRLIRAMAEDFLPGFQVNMPPPQRRPKYSHTVGGLDLYNAVHELRKAKGGTILEACRHLSRHDNRWRNSSPEALETAFHRATGTMKEAMNTVANHPFLARMVKLVGIDELARQAEAKEVKRKTSKSS